MEGDRSRGALARAYADHAPFVRRRLSYLGVGPQDLDDACHDVFVVAARKLPVADPTELRPWLEEVARKVSAGRRRRAAHRRERLAEAPEPAVEPPSEGGDPAIRTERATLLRVAFSRLPPTEQDALALHAVGELPVASVARLLERDPKTARARIGGAKRRLASQLQLLEARRVAPSSPSIAVRDDVRHPESAPPPSSRPAYADGFEVTTDDPDKSLGLVDNALVAVWRSKVTQADVDVLERTARRLRARRAGPLAYVAVVESGWQPPDARTRERLVSLLRGFHDDLVLHANVVPDSTSRLARPMITALGFLAGHHTPTAFFPNPETLGDVVRSLQTATAARTRLPSAPSLLSALRHLRTRTG